MSQHPDPHTWHETDEIYIDETAQSGPRWLVLGGVMFPKKYSVEFERDVLVARQPFPTHHHDGTPYELGWNNFKSSRREFEAYKRVMNAYFSFGNRFKSPFDIIRFHSAVIDTHVRGRRYSGKAGQIGFNREIYFHCLRIGRSPTYRTRVFDVYPDYRTTKQLPEQLHGYLCMGLRRHLPADKRYLPFRKVHFRLSHEWQALQVSDILIGAMQYRLNGWLENPTSNPMKKELCEFVLKKGKIWAACAPDNPLDQDWGPCRIWVRKHPE